MSAAAADWAWLSSCLNRCEVLRLGHVHLLFADGANVSFGTVPAMWEKPHRGGAIFITDLQL
jgi:hypothetical protein